MDSNQILPDVQNSIAEKGFQTHFLLFNKNSSAENTTRQKSWESFSYENTQNWVASIVAAPYLAPTMNARIVRCPSPSPSSTVPSAPLCFVFFLFTLFPKLYNILCAPNCGSLSTVFLSQADTCIMRTLGKTWTSERCPAETSIYPARREREPQNLWLQLLTMGNLQRSPCPNFPSTKGLSRQWQSGRGSNNFRREAKKVAVFVQFVTVWCDLFPPENPSKSK